MRASARTDTASSELPLNSQNFESCGSALLGTARAFLGSDLRQNHKILEVRPRLVRLRAVCSWRRDSGGRTGGMIGSVTKVVPAAVLLLLSVIRVLDALEPKPKPI
ncbi:hypothetical protein DAH94_02235 [Sphingomonas koreensis]|nr:hypothetical protein DAH94_02235 [Sphingomonas koreensis]